MSTGVPDNYTKHDVINLAQWLIGEKTHYTNYIDSAMYQKQMELTAKLREAQDRTSISRRRTVSCKSASTGSPRLTPR